MALFGLLNPPVGFHFILIMELNIIEYPGIPDIGFQEVTGIDVTINTEEFREGGENRFAHKLPTNISFPNLVLKRGLLYGSQAWDWFNNSLETFQFSPKDITLVLLNQLHLPVQAWNFVNAYPVKWAVSGFNAEQNGLVIENLEFAYQYSRRLDPSDLIGF
ncbi:MAG: phage tail protein [Bacteroidia bacterium]|nr:phage tail protein [Bacteroidia bacterium]